MIWSAIKRLLSKLAHRERDGTWHHADATKLRRYVNGRWQYRDATAQESADWDSDRVW